MPIKNRKTVNGRTVKLKKYSGKWWVDVDGHAKTPQFASKAKAKREFDRAVEQIGKRPGKKGTNYGENTLDDALGF